MSKKALKEYVNPIFENEFNNIIKKLTLKEEK